MKIKKKIKIVVDILMAVCMFVAMNYQIWGGSAHKKVSMVLLVLFILHNVLNIKWYKALFRGKYTPMRTFHTITNVSVWTSLIFIVYSGVLMIREIIVTGMIAENSFGGFLHVFSSWWCMVSMVLHTGFHVKMFRQSIRKILNIKENEMTNSGLSYEE